MSNATITLNHLNRAYFLPRDGVWTDGGENHYEESNYKYHPVLNPILNSVTVVRTTKKKVSFKVSIDDQTYDMDVHCTPSGKARSIDGVWDTKLYEHLRRVLYAAVDLKVGWSLEIFEGFMMDAAEDAVAKRKLAA